MRLEFLDDPGLERCKDMLDECEELLKTTKPNGRMREAILRHMCEMKMIYSNPRYIDLDSVPKDRVE